MRARNRWVAWIGLFAWVAAPCIGGTALHAAEAGPDTGVMLEEIVVTAQKREQNLQDVGASITAFDAKLMENLGFRDVTDIVSQVPGLQFNQYGATVTVYNLRGVSQNDFADHQEAPVAFYADDVYVASTGALAGSLFDLERVEVLRGPQGTLFGRNATGGLIHHISRRPTDTPEGFLTVTSGNFGAIGTEGAISGPLTDGLAARFSFATSHHDGYIKNLIGHSINDQKQYAARALFQFKVAGQGEALVKLHALTNDNETAGNYSFAGSRMDATGRGVFSPDGDFFGYLGSGSDPFTQSVDRRGFFDRDIWGGSARIEWDLAGASLSSVTDYMHLRKRYGEDVDVSPNFVFNFDPSQNYEQFSQELRLSGSQERLRWIAGLYYLNYRTSNLQLLDITPIFGGPTSVDFGLRTSAIAGFGQIEYDLNTQWTLVAGARFTRDDKEFNYEYQPQGLIYNASTDPTASRSFNIPTGKLGLDYKPTQDLLLYVSVNRGAKSGGWTAANTGVVSATDLPFDQEKLTSYEAGVKSTFLEGAARLNAAVFYYDYKDYQGFLPQGLTQVVLNRDAVIKGGEIEFAIVPAPGLNFQLGVSHLSSRVNNIPTLTGFIATTEAPQAPRFSVNAVARYEWSAFGGKVAVGADAKWSDDQFLELINAPVDLQPAYAVTNVRLSYSSDGGAWETAAFVKNVTNEYYRIYNLDLAVIGFNQGVYAPPRLYGVSFTYRWGS